MAGPIPHAGGCTVGNHTAGAKCLTDSMTDTLRSTVTMRCAGGRSPALSGCICCAVGIRIGLSCSMTDTVGAAACLRRTNTVTLALRCTDRVGVADGFVMRSSAVPVCTLTGGPALSCSDRRARSPGFTIAVRHTAGINLSNACTDSCTNRIGAANCLTDRLRNALVPTAALRCTAVCTPALRSAGGITAGNRMRTAVGYTV